MPHTASFSTSDTEFMARAIQLARQGMYTTSPNPRVGCVIVSPENQVVAEGAHLKAGLGHAEVNALAQIDRSAEGCTAYVTLEPCSHYGKTPPCCEALIAAGVTRVVVAMQDPNPLVSGRGLSMLRDAGIQVDVGLLRETAEQLNPGFIKRQLTGIPKVTVKLAATLDGKTALANGQSQWITGPEARSDVQRYRAQSCAILSGAGTVLADDPALNVRFEQLPASAQQAYQRVLLALDAQVRQPLRVILDGKGVLNPDLNVFADGNVLVINSRTNRALAEMGVAQWQAPMRDGKIDLAAVLQHLGSLQINDVWLEAGAKLAGAFIHQNLADELILYQAPKLMGDSAMSLLNMPELTAMSQLPELILVDSRIVGNDIKLTARFEQTKKQD